MRHWDEKQRTHRKVSRKTKVFVYVYARRRLTYRFTETSKARHTPDPKDRDKWELGSEVGGVPLIGNL